ASASNKYITSYFRTKLNIPDPARFGSFALRVYADDGIVIYINGREAARYNIDTLPSASTLATEPAEEDGHRIISFAGIPASFFRPGANTIAAEVHQAGVTSTDLVFDLELAAIGKTPEKPILRGPLLQMLSTNAVNIKWRTAGPASSRVRYGKDPNHLSSVATISKATTEHEVRIENLQPDTRYYYAIGSTASTLIGSYRNSFTTAPPPGTTRKIRIGVFGDAGTGNKVQKATRDGYLHLPKGGSPDLALLLGDNAYNSGTDEQHQQKMFDIYGNTIFANHPVFSVPGNHEYDNDPKGLEGLRGTHQIPYYDIFSLPTDAECGGIPSGTEHYYSFDYGDIHFIMLDSYGYDDNKLLYDSTGVQAQWLKTDLAAYYGKRKWTIVCLHHPPYTHGTHDSERERDLISIRRQITPILERYNVDVVLAGHSHVYERSFLIQGHIGFEASFNATAPPQGNLVSGSSARYDGTENSCPYFTIDTVEKHGTVYVVAGSAGQVGGGTNGKYPLFYYKNYSGSENGEGGALYLEIQDNRLDAKFIGASGLVRDYFTIMKGVNRKSTIQAMINKPATLRASWTGSYNWFAATDSTASLGTARTLLITPSAAGTFTYYATDSVGAEHTCITDTFTVVVGSALSMSVSGYDALAKNDKTIVQWNTSHEINSDYFTIERSANGRDFETLMVMPGAGRSDATLHYEFTDNSPLPGANYYRLSATDRRGNDKAVGIRVVNR
ncbi:MAG: metallophosphoesterase family protein, partial [Bacteroidetes bacterium]|nr:metallophosphoesterase family protein [Bacteroidota bacterium]